MSNNSGRIEWEYLQTGEGQLKPGFRVSDSEVADFSIADSGALDTTFDDAVCLKSVKSSDKVAVTKGD